MPMPMPMQTTIPTITPIIMNCTDAPAVGNGTGSTVVGESAKT